jgi:glycerol kinase
MSLTLEQLPKLQEQINQTLATLLSLEEEMLPEVQKKIQNIAELLTVGFDESKLKTQVVIALNQALTSSQIADITKSAKGYQDTLNSSIKNLQTTILQIQGQANQYIEKTATHKSIYVGIITGALAFVAGAAVVWGVQYNRMDRYQFAIGQTDTMARYINSSCKIKQDYGKYIGQPIENCNNWYAPTEIIAKKAQNDQ